MNLALLVPLTGIPGAVLSLPPVRAVVTHIERRTPDSVSGPELDRFRDERQGVRERLEALETIGDRVADVEERIDFDERRLLQQRESARLPKGE